MVNANGAIVTIWGARGELPCAGPEFIGFGGNTCCISVESDGRLFVFGAGTGFRVLGNALIARGGLLDIDIFLTHSYLDQIQGIPFFKAFYNPKNIFRLWAGHLSDRGGLHGAISGMMQAPLFPIPPSVFTADIAYRDFQPGEAIDLGGGFQCCSAAMDRIDGATAYRLDFPDGRALAVLPRAGGLERADVLDLCNKADMLIADNPGTEGLPALRAFADRAAVLRLVLGSHLPDQTDEELTRMADQAEGSILHVAREGERLAL